MKRTFIIMVAALFLSCEKDEEHGVPFTYEAECVNCRVTIFEPIRSGRKYTTKYVAYPGVKGKWSKSFIAGSNHKLEIRAESDVNTDPMKVSIIVNGEVVDEAFYQGYSDPNVVAIAEAEYKLSMVDYNNAE